MNRYNNDTVKLNDDNKRVYELTPKTYTKTSDIDIYIISKETDRLDLLAHKYYNDVTKWVYIAEANNIFGTLYIEPGTQLRIPMTF